MHPGTSKRAHVAGRSGVSNMNSTNNQ